ncbi:MAG: hypothetical protein KBB91_02385 [Candidatus Pacebacteria bacterium]|jgi:hypothetical protein|nr:hypothetical protein [Candidatus Paceibacterota bacterium]MBP9701124.1 hypothetical protein [Candidatus Paceibacterota bacterium]
MKKVNVQLEPVFKSEKSGKLFLELIYITTGKKQLPKERVNELLNNWYDSCLEDESYPKEKMDEWVADIKSDALKDLI